jgi:tRNA pseudouridine13 synthase
MSRLPDFPRSQGYPQASGRIRVFAEDFQVEELTPFQPDGEGEHVLLWVEKREANTDWVARGLGRHAGVKPVAVGYAGLKDRQAVTRQWFSIHLAGRDEPDWQALELEGVRVLESHRHGRKLRRGTLKGNRFVIRIREFQGDRGEVQARLESLARFGMPNYFGDQRFGHEGGNLDKADAMLRGGLRVKDRHRRGLYLSAARSLLFNRVLARRVEQDNWRQALPGEVLMLDGSHSVFRADEIDDELRQRLRDHEVHPTGPLWGRGRPLTGGAALELEQEVLAGDADWRNGLEHVGLKQERRALRVIPGDLRWDWPEGDLELRFFLPAGAYATSLLRELVSLR